MKHDADSIPSQITARAAAFSIAALACSCQPGCLAAFECGPDTGMVEHVIDGDTLDLADGTRIRILGIDAPESDACWGPQATATATSLLEGRPVELRYAGECTDDYGRTLASVIVGGRDAATTLARAGAACAWILQAFQGAAAVRAAARQASSDGAGLWGGCFTVPCRGD